MKVTSDGFGGRDDEAHVRIFSFAERRGDADIDGVESTDDGEVGGGAEFAAFYKRREGFVWDVFDVGMTSVELVDLGLLDVDADDFKTRFGEFDGERQTNVAEAENAHFGSFVAYFFLQLGG